MPDFQKVIIVSNISISPLSIFRLSSESVKLPHIQHINLQRNNEQQKQ